jgi:hypothetical protein
MARTRVRDGDLEVDIQLGSKLCLLCPEWRSLLINIGRLNTAIPMTSYNIARVGVTDVWNITATTQDLRSYSSTVTIVDGLPLYTLASLPQGTDGEILAFFTLARLFAVILKTLELETAAITWS